MHVLFYLIVQTSDFMYSKHVKQISSIYGTNCACISLSATNVRKKYRRFAHGESCPGSTSLTAVTEKSLSERNNIRTAKWTVGRSLRLSLMTNLWNMIDNPAPRRVKCNDFPVSSFNKLTRCALGNSEYSFWLYKRLKQIVN